ncbi:MAG: hypothetical protein ABJE66_14210 [Deltaproteobacteria bacterium]
MKQLSIALLCVSCGSPAATPDSMVSDGSGSAAIDARGDAPSTGGAALGIVDQVTDVACPSGAGGPPAGSTCKRVRVSGCAGIETETVTALVAVLAPANVTRTVVHLKGGGGEGFQISDTAGYQANGFREVFVSWDTDWEQTASHGIKTAACRPATVIKWVFDEPSLHAQSRTNAFCAEGFSGGSGQIGYALADFGLADYLDYVNELSGPPFTRLDLGCDGNAPPSAMVCGETVTTKLPNSVTAWENLSAPCGSASLPAGERARLVADSIATDGSFAYPRTRMEFFDCTNNATAVTSMSQLLFDQITQAEGAGAQTAYHCYAQADGCMGEGLGALGSSEASHAMVAGCTPRHP